MLGGHYEADDRPDRSMVDGLHHGRALEFGVFLAWPERHPANGNLAAVANEAWWVAGVDEGLELRAVCLGSRCPRRQGPARATSAVVHAPTAASHRAPFGIEQLFDVRPAIGREGQDGEVHGLVRGVISPGAACVSLRAESCFATSSERPRRAAQYGTSVQFADPVTGSSGIPWRGAKNR